MKFSSKSELGQDYVVPPLEGLWWADDPKSFVAREKDQWRWTMMIMVPDFVTTNMFDSAVAKVNKKLGEAPQSLRFENILKGNRSKSSISAATKTKAPSWHAFMMRKCPKTE